MHINIEFQYIHSQYTIHSTQWSLRTWTALGLALTKTQLTGDVKINVYTYGLISAIN